MALKVMKFGGTSVADVPKIQHVAKRVLSNYEAGHDCVVVVSAMGKTTDQLVAMAKEISESKEPIEREMDVLLSTGEQITIALLAMAINAKGYPSISMTGSQVGIITDKVHGKARITEIKTDRLRTLLDERKIVIVAGFQGTTHDNNITTLGRGGSDLTAVALAAALKADVCEIFTDVNGVYTTDPRIVPDACKLEKITYDEMLELATLGANVLHNRSVECAKNYNVVLHVRSTFNEETGTLVVKEFDEMEEIIISGIAYRRNEAKITLRGIPDEPGCAARLFEELSNAQIAVDMIIQNEVHNGKNDIGFTVNQDEVEKVRKLCEKISAELKTDGVVIDENVAKVSAVGVGMQTHVDVAAAMFRALAQNNINIHSITTSEIKISVLIDEDQADQAVQSIHEQFELAKLAANNK